MSANQGGHLFRYTSFGESHGPALGAVIEGCPAGLPIELQHVQRWCERRRPGQDVLVSARQEKDQVRILSGVFEDVSLGTPICLIVENQDAQSKDYDTIKATPRLGHADDMWQSKFGHRDHRGGGRSSGRETLSRVLSGAIAQLLVQKIRPEIKVQGYCQQIGPVQLSAEEKDLFLRKAGTEFASDQYRLRFPSEKSEEKVEQLLMKAKSLGHSYGGVAGVCVQGLPVGLGQPVFRKLKADLAQASLSIGATMTFELGAGRSVVDQEGSFFHSQYNQRAYGGIRGGLSTGEPIEFQVTFKPTSSVLDIAKKGRHDPCIVPRAVPVLEAMTWLVLADHLLWQRLDRL